MKTNRVLPARIFASSTSSTPCGVICWPFTKVPLVGGGSDHAQPTGAGGTLAVGTELRQLGERNGFDDDTKNPFPEILGLEEFCVAVLRVLPCRRDQKEHCLTAIYGAGQCGHPALPGGDTASVVDVEKIVAPAIPFEPVRKRQSLGVVSAGVADEDP